MQPAILFLAAFLTAVRAIIPMPCANIGSLTSRECCPVPKIGRNVGPCGVNLGRGICAPITISAASYNSNETDVRVNWPIQYFDRTCRCNERYGGYDCGECSYAYNDGTTSCTEKTIFSRILVGEMSRKNWRCYHKALRAIKDNSSRYMVATKEFTSDLQEVVNSLVRPTTYNLFVWVHHFVAKDNEVTEDKNPITDYAHEGTGFPTWHRQFLLWVEREIQIEINDHTFRLPYWDWSDPSQREILFTRERLGENVEEVNTNGVTITVVKGELFTDWNTYCWKDITGKAPLILICDPTTTSKKDLRRCPRGEFCKKNNSYWPSKTDVDTAVSIKSYDASPFTRSVKEKSSSFRNYMEGFIFEANGCGMGNKMCSKKKNGEHFTRKLHNSVHILLGFGGLDMILDFEKQGVMGCVAASPNDPIFINHHANIDCILEQWLQKNKDNLSYPISDDIREGHRGNDYIVPFMPLYTHNDMFKTADNFGYRCSATSIQAYTTSVFIGVIAFAIIWS